MANEPEEIWIQQIIARITEKREAAAFREIVDRYKSMAFLHAIRILKNREDAQEAVQDAFVKAFRSIHLFKGNAKFSTWFYRILYNTCLTKLTKKRLSTISLDTGQENESVLYSENGREWQALQKQERDKYFNIALAKLSPEDAMILNLYYVSESNIEEISAIIDCSRSAAKVRLHRARNRMHAILTKLLQNEINDLL